jgi:tellurite resistance protein
MGAVAQYLSNASADELSVLDNLVDDQKMALLEVIVLAMYADGVISLEELGMIGRVASELPPFADTSEDELQQAMSRAIKTVESIGSSDDAADFLKRVAARLDGRVPREVAFGAALAVSYADGVVVPAEQNFLKDLIVTFEIPAARAQVIIDEIREYVASHR